MVVCVPSGTAAAGRLRRTGLALLLLAVLAAAGGIVLHRTVPKFNPVLMPPWPAVRSEALAQLPAGELVDVEPPDWAEEPQRPSRHHACLGVTDYILALWSISAVKLDERCSLASGSWALPLSGRLSDKPDRLAAEPVIPAIQALAAGLNAVDAQRWRQPSREDAWMHLPMMRRTARARAGRSIEEWIPPHPLAACEYGRRWLAVKTRFRLRATSAERAAIAGAMALCPWSHH